MARSLFLMILMVAGSIGFQSPSQAQSPVLAELYGRGVHAYYCGHLIDAHRYLSLAIDHGSRDPRTYYFRGVVNAATGRQHEAEADWRTGAQFEIEGEYGAGIGRALHRVQGPVRMELENVRQMVRLENRATQSAKDNARYNDLKAAEGTVLRGTTPPPVTPAAPAAPNDENTNNPFGKDSTDTGEPVPDAKNDPFKDDPAQPSAPAPGADPFGGAAEPAGADPFGGAAEPAGADPFGGAAEPAAPAPAAEPAADPFGGGDSNMSDPFGGSDPFGT
ncbi:hypothetical protein Poly24_49720 [Rosistilla carotiformis]|uniref:Tetratricopeptide repeat protein n=1 Tax=Rosistilla carotiformis TaxID=2528017 RepID=A0A518K0D1_9BACT|nr:hypothetical protein [Rosistilla carotiformis]QDV71238.1 hypothetical protein Poly24_49720 [Rosistilla carotiformis]